MINNTVLEQTTM